MTTNDDDAAKGQKEPAQAGEKKTDGRSVSWWRPGQSGNPSGRRKADSGKPTIEGLGAKFREHGRRYGDKAIEKLYEENPNAYLRQWRQAEEHDGGALPGSSDNGAFGNIPPNILRMMICAAQLMNDVPSFVGRLIVECEGRGIDCKEIRALLDEMAQQAEPLPDVSEEVARRGRPGYYRQDYPSY